ncbi:hypothetical protein Tco_0720001 [Tanacetum coccineum]
MVQQRSSIGSRTISLWILSPSSQERKVETTPFEVGELDNARTRTCSGKQPSKIVTNKYRMQAAVIAKRSYAKVRLKASRVSRVGDRIHVKGKAYSPSSSSMETPREAQKFTWEREISSEISFYTFFTKTAPRRMLHLELGTRLS